MNFIHELPDFSKKIPSCFDTTLYISHDIFLDFFSDSRYTYITISNFAHQKINCAQTVSDVARFSIWFLASKEECTRKAVIWKLPQISRIARKSLLCNVSMNTCLDDRASRVGSVISVGTLPLRRTTQWCITLQKTQRKHQRVRKCPLKYLNPPWGEYGKTRSSNIETAKQSDFPQAVSDKAISRHSSGYSDP